MARRLKALSKEKQVPKGTVNHQIKMIEQWEGRIKTLENGLPNASASEKAAIEHHVEVAKGEIKNLQIAALRTKKALLETKALLGISTDPSIQVQIEDIQNYFIRVGLEEGELE